MLTFKVDDSVLRRKLAAANDTRMVRREAVIFAAEKVNRTALLLASEHRDTGRFMRAQAEAGNKAGIGAFPLSPVGPSQMQVRFIQILTAQVRRWKKFAELYQKEGKAHTRYYQKIRKNIERAQEQLDRFTRGMHAGAIVVDAFSGGAKMTTVRVNFSAYGGDGRIRTVGEDTFVQLHNKEPHASIVEYRFGIMRRAVRAGGGPDVRRFTKKAFVQQLRKAGFAAG